LGLVVKFEFENNTIDSKNMKNAKLKTVQTPNNNSHEIHPPHFGEDSINGLFFTIGSVLDISNISLIGDYSLTTWFETPLPNDAWNYNSLCSGGDDDNVPVIVQRSNNHLGVWKSGKPGVFFDSGFDISSLSKGKHFLVALADDKKNITTFYIDNIKVGESKFKSMTQISNIGNNGTFELGFQQHFGWIYDFRVYDEKLNLQKIKKIYEQSLNLMAKKMKIKDSKITIELTNVSKHFFINHENNNTIYELFLSIFDKKSKVEKLSVLKNVSFSVKKGEMLGILGFNGSGKTTLLKMIANIMMPDTGEVYTNGRITPFLELGTGFNGELTARDNIIQYGVILGFSKKEIEKKIEKIIEFAELEKFLDTKLKNFSAGMYTRLAFSTAIEVNPDILLIDEVLSVGDVRFQEKSFNAIMKFKKENKTIIFVSHSIDDIKKYCDRALWIDNGSVRSYGDPTTVVDEYEKFAFM
jgi:ABC-type polysaccharide/polyol phosphate transport system ATPase subunit